MRPTSKGRSPRERFADEVQFAFTPLTLNFWAIFQVPLEARPGFACATVGLAVLLFVRATAGFFVRTK